MFDAELARVWTIVYSFTARDPDGGRLRILRSCGNIEDYSTDVTPFGGTVLAFRRSDNPGMAIKSFDGERRMIQMSWVKQGRFAWYAQRAARWWTHALKRVDRGFPWLAVSG